MEKLEPSYTAGENATALVVLERIKHSVSSTPRHVLKRNENVLIHPHKNLYMNVHSSITYNH